MMRIITGKARGIKLNTLEGEATRPTAERIKEAVFSKLQFDIEGRKILDLFSGSGQLALEALSRGASEATLIDNSPEAIKIIRENANKTKLLDSCRIYKSDALDYIKRNKGERFDIVFLDPPYASQLYTLVLNALIEFDMLKATSIIVCESDREIFDDKIKEKYEIVKTNKYGKTIITFAVPVIKEK